MLRSVGGVVLGFVASNAVVIIGVMLAARALAGPDYDPGPAYLTANLVISFGAALLGGFIAGRVAGRRPVLHGVILAAVFAGLTLPTLASPAPGQPAWYPATIMVLGAAGAVVGGALVHWMRPRSAAAAERSPA